MTDPTEAIRKALEAYPKGWKLDHAKEGDDAGFAEVGSMLDGEFYSVVIVDTDNYEQPDDALLIAQFIAACNPAAIRALLDRLDSAERNERRYLWTLHHLGLIEDHAMLWKPSKHKPLLDYLQDFIDAAIDEQLRSVGEKEPK